MSGYVNGPGPLEWSMGALHDRADLLHGPESDGDAAADAERPLSHEDPGKPVSGHQDRSRA